MKTSLIILTLLFQLNIANAKDVKSQAAPEKTQATHSLLSAEEKALVDGGEISTTRYIAGGIIGTWLGMGIGHGIQGRYKETGWKFTVAEIGGGLLFAPALINCSLSILSSRAPSCKMSSTESLGLTLFVVGRIWEIIDIWAAPPFRNSRIRNLKRLIEPKTQTYLVPTNDGLQLGLLYSF